MPIVMVGLEAVMQSYGAVVVDNRHPTGRMPTRSLITGLVGNALGLNRADAAGLARLQDAYEYAVRMDTSGEVFTDYHTVDLGSEKMQRIALDERGKVLTRGSGAATKETHIMLKEYLVGARATVALAFEDAALAELVAERLECPVRPLFIGRKCCPPSQPLFRGIIEAESVLHAVVEAPLMTEFPDPLMLASWPVGDTHARASGEEITRRDRVDYATGEHLGLSRRIEGFIRPLAKA